MRCWTRSTGERGALPLLAFAVARLWEKRDRERRAAHPPGLRRHRRRRAAPWHTTPRRPLERIGTDRTAHRPRALPQSRHRRGHPRGPRVERASVRCSAIRRDESPRRRCFGELIDARLLTSYEVREEDASPTRRVEIIHESLLANWPRLVRWQTQDADAAQLRDQLRQAARTWDEHDRSR